MSNTQNKNDAIEQASTANIGYTPGDVKKLINYILDWCGKNINMIPLVIMANTMFTIMNYLLLLKQKR